MFLSCLLIDIGINPDRPRPGRLWLRNLYRVHQRLCMAFPSAPRKDGDPDFLAPYAPGDFPEQRHLADKKKTEIDPDVLKDVHSARGPDAGFLFRIDPGPAGRAVILVQSAVQPDWDYAFQNARFLLAAPAEVKGYEPGFAAGQRLRFRLAANPTRKLSRHSRERDGKPVAEKWIGKRVPVPSDQLLDWLAEWRVRPDESPGFCIDKDSTTVQAGYIYVNKGWEEGGQRLRSVRYDGILEVTDPDKFRNTLLRGVGPGKAFGFGLLSVAPLSL
jgi:CRISPR system Cascade subunit CasE